MSPITSFVVVGELAIALAALGLGWWLSGEFWPRWDVSAAAGALGVAAALPWVLMAAWTISPAGQQRPELRRILETTRSRLGPWLASLPITSALVVAAAAGIAEELLFRGVLLALLRPDAAGLVLTSVLFGLLHAVTPTYAILAGLMGLWLGILQLASDNLLVPVITHAVYDLAALMMLRRVFRISAG